VCQTRLSFGRPSTRTPSTSTISALIAKPPRETPVLVSKRPLCFHASARGLDRQPVGTGRLQLGVRSLSTRSKWILIAGPYRSGTGDNPDLLEKNVKCMESFALPVFRAGHMPLLGEWLALPLVQAAGSQRIGDAVFNEIFHPFAVRLLDKCDAVLRVGGPSAGADEMVRLARERGLDVYAELEEIPGYSERAPD